MVNVPLQCLGNSTTRREPVSPGAGWAELPSDRLGLFRVVTQGWILVSKGGRELGRLRRWRNEQRYIF